MPECDGATAHADIVWSCWSAHSTGLGPTLPPPAAPAALLPPPLGSVTRPVTVPGGDVQLGQGLGHPQLVLGGLYVDVVNLKHQHLGLDLNNLSNGVPGTHY